MKILSVILIVLLLVVGGVSGYYIWDLNGQIDELETALSDTIEQMSYDTLQVISERDRQIQESIDQTSSSIEGFSETTSDLIDGIDRKIEFASFEIERLDKRDKELTELISTTTFDSTTVYEQVIESVIRISDGEYLSGSGFIASFDENPDEHKVITAYHVVEDLESIYVTANDGKSWKAEIQIFSKECDVAVLELIGGDASSIPAVKVADSSTALPGDYIVVIGSPGDTDLKLGLKGSVTTGIVSQTRRTGTFGEIRTPNLIQYDAATNFGNSGGPLFNAQGEVIGLVMGIINPLLGDGICFAVASNQITKVASIEIPATDEPYNYPFPYIGITVVDIQPQDTDLISEGTYSGARIDSSDNPGNAAGLYENTIIVEIGNHPVSTSDEFYSYLAELYIAGDEIPMQIISSGSYRNITVTAETQP